MPKWAKMSDFAITLPDRPGELAKLTGRLRDESINLVGLWGYGSGTNGSASFYCVPENADEFRSFAEADGLEVEEGATFFLHGRDAIGALTATLEHIAGAGVNLRAIQSTTFEGEFAAFVWVDPADWGSLERVSR